MFLCAKCGKSFHSDSPKVVGADFIYSYEEGQPVPDIALYCCDYCYYRRALAKVLPADALLDAVQKAVQEAEQKIYKELDELNVKSSN